MAGERPRIGDSTILISFCFNNKKKALGDPGTAMVSAGGRGSLQLRRSRYRSNQMKPTSSTLARYTRPRVSGWDPNPTTLAPVGSATNPRRAPVLSKTSYRGAWSRGMILSTHTSLRGETRVPFGRKGGRISGHWKSSIPGPPPDPFARGAAVPRAARGITCAATAARTSGSRARRNWRSAG